MQNLNRRQTQQQDFEKKNAQGDMYTRQERKTFQNK